MEEEAKNYRLVFGEAALEAAEVISEELERKEAELVAELEFCQSLLG